VTASEAFDEVELLLTQLILLDRWGDIIVGIRAMGAIHRHLPDELAKLENDFESLMISPEEYVDAFKALTVRFKELRFANQLDSCLAKLGNSA
jgi:hypothetical protein